MTEGNSAPAKEILIVAGDVSGDVHAANLIKEFKALDKNIVITSIGGERMKAASDNFLYDMVSKGATGFVEPFKKIPQFLDVLKTIKNYMAQKRPACVITVDFYGFNRRVLGVAKEQNIPAYYYVCPQVWASRKYRAKAIVKLAKKMFVIFPFEKKIYTDLGGDALFLGHPLMDTVPLPKNKTYTEDKQREWKIGYLPGSRPAELAKHTLMFWQSFLEIKKEYPNAKAYLYAVDEVSDQKLAGLLGGSIPQDLNIVRESNFAVRSEMDFVVVCSGTATLENALLGIPMLVVYKTSWITYHIAKMIIQVPYISLVNILSNAPVVKEFIQKEANSKDIAKEVCSVLGSGEKYKAMRAKLLQIREDLGQPGVAKRSAKIISDEIFAK